MPSGRWCWQTSALARDRVSTKSWPVFERLYIWNAMRNKNDKGAKLKLLQHIYCWNFEKVDYHNFLPIFWPIGINCVFRIFCAFFLNSKLLAEFRLRRYISFSLTHSFFISLTHTLSWEKETRERERERLWQPQRERAREQEREKVDRSEIKCW
jgi:hypothetical protein